MRFARSRKKLFFSVLFASNFSLPTNAKLIERIFALFRSHNKRFFSSFHFTGYRLEKLKDRPWYFSSFLYKLSLNFTLSFSRFEVFTFFVLFSLHFIFVSHRCKKSTFFSHQSEKILLSVSLHFASKRKWRRTLGGSAVFFFICCVKR